MARYVERAENLARILDVNETFARDRDRRSGVAALSSSSIPMKGPFFEKHDEATAKAVVNFYIADRDNPEFDFRNPIRAARENARRALRHLDQHRSSGPS